MPNWRSYRKHLQCERAKSRCTIFIYARKARKLVYAFIIFLHKQEIVEILDAMYPRNVCIFLDVQSDLFGLYEDFPANFHLKCLWLSYNYIGFHEVKWTIQAWWWCVSEASRRPKWEKLNIRRTLRMTTMFTEIPFSVNIIKMCW